MKTVVTGGAGFIGSHLAAALASFTECHIVDDLSTGRLENVPESARLWEGSIGDETLLLQAFAGAKWVFHEAAIPSVQRSMERPELTMRTNLEGTLTVLRSAKAMGVERVIFASSAAVYGNTPTLPKTEDSLTAPTSPYGFEKLSSEWYLRFFSQHYGLPTVALRYFNVYGRGQDPRGDYSGVVSKFIERSFKGEPLTIHGDGGQSRDFVHVDDVVACNILAAKSAHSEGRVYNVGTGNPTTVMELAKAVQRVCKSDAVIQHDPPRSGDIRESYADISRARRELGYEPRVGLAEGLRRTIEGAAP